MGPGDPELLAEMEHIGRMLFGSAYRFRLGIWIAGLPGAPRTFSVLEYWSFCTEAGWPGAGKPITSYMRRFEIAGMAERSVVRRRRPLWVKLDSPAWEFFESLDPWRRAHQPKVKLSDLAAHMAKFDLQKLRTELTAARDDG
jgi:hypothetical protein